MVKKSIQSRNNPLIKEWTRLHNSRHRTQSGKFLIEGRREIEHALGAGYTITDLIYTPEKYAPDVIESIVASLDDRDTIRIVDVSPSVLEKLSFRQNFDGLIAVAISRSRALADLQSRARPFFLVVERVEKPGNLGALLRTADGAGVDGVLLIDSITDIYNPNVIRSSQGLVFSQTIVSTSLDAFTTWLEDNPLPLFAATPEATETYVEADYSSGAAIIVGNEAEGLTADLQSLARNTVRIPMHGQADSLNVSVAAAILLYHASAKIHDKKTMLSS